MADEFFIRIHIFDLTFLEKYIIYFQYNIMLNDNLLRYNTLKG